MTGSVTSTASSYRLVKGCLRCMIRGVTTGSVPGRRPGSAA